MIILLTVVSLVCAVLSLMAIVPGWWLIIEHCVRPERTGSLVPLFGGVFGALALCLWPHNGLCGWWWLAFVIDPGSGLLLATSAWFYLGRNRL